MFLSKKVRVIIPPLWDYGNKTQGCRGNRRVGDVIEGYNQEAERHDDQCSHSGDTDCAFETGGFLEVSQLTSDCVTRAGHSASQHSMRT